MIVESVRSTTSSTHHYGDVNESSDRKTHHPMNDDKRAVDSLAESIQHSIAAIEKGIEAYVFHGDDFAYRHVVMELRKLLLDRNAVSSFRKSIRRAKNSKNLLELHFGKGKNILLKSFH